MARGFRVVLKPRGMICVSYHVVSIFLHARKIEKMQKRNSPQKKTGRLFRPLSFEEEN